ncbi:ABC transporter substrate-binding protein [Chelatococcus reniformis]|nr:ABC transporter substrate-binding protein [Chelatococcus reniformis]
MNRLPIVLGVMLGLAVAVAHAADNAIGVTASEIKIGTTMPFSGPASALGNTGKGLIAYVDLINERGGVGGRKINLIALDDGYMPPRAVEQTRKLIEQDEVAFIFSPLGTPSNSATIKYINGKKVPDAFIMTGAAKFARAAEYPYTTTALPSYETEARIYARFIEKARPGAKIGILYQNDDLGKDFVSGVKAVLRDAFAQRVVALPYEVADATVDSQILNLKNAGVDALLLATTPKFAAQAIKKTAEIGWQPLRIVNVVSSSVSATLKPAGLDNAKGVLSAVFYKDPADPAWKDSREADDYLAFVGKYLPGADAHDINYITGYNQGMILEHLLKQCGEDLSRDNINRQAHAIRDLQLPMILPGIRVNTSPENNQAWTQLQLQRWTGERWELIGSVLQADSD